VDDRRFDLLAKTLSAAPSRRGLLAGLLAALGAGGADAEAAPGGEGKRSGKGPGGRGGKEHGRNRGNGRNRPGNDKGGDGNGKGKGKGGGKGCTPTPKAEACASACGPVDLGCGKRADCEPCAACADDADCAPCGTCADGACVPAREKHGDACALRGGGDGVCAGGACEPCGGPKQRCCPGDVPCADFGCCDPANKRCVAGGGGGPLLETACAGEHRVCGCDPSERVEADEEGRDRIAFTCTRPGACRTNHAPEAFDQLIQYIHPGGDWDTHDVVPVTLTGFDADDDWLYVRIVEGPTQGWLETNDSWEVLRGAGWSEGAPPPAVAAAPCIPHCFRDESCPDSNDVCPGCGPCPEDHCVPTEYKYCQEGQYRTFALVYRPNSTRWNGSDVFRYSVIDQHGAESAPARVTISVIISDD
jgi:hypothetical protein